MDFIKKYISENGVEIIEKLVSSGFDLDQAKQFLPEAELALLDVARMFDIKDLVSSFSSGDHGRLLSMVNIDGIAARVGITAGQARAGMGAILPSISSVLANGNELDDAVSGSSDGLMRAVNKLFSR